MCMWLLYCRLPPATASSWRHAFCRAGTSCIFGSSATTKQLYLRYGHFQLGGLYMHPRTILTKVMLEWEASTSVVAQQFARSLRWQRRTSMSRPRH
ncbi:hypothetical protein PR002_g18504 [Phytophthora rubi]|uniref:Secreted protein n=1 Tax=Phytophthora rubi TaxID=129364 RepID=A0A6A3K115_9STRA|nr:hypothetical protein PR002_g18504 [Phytophthora rubi]